MSDTPETDAASQSWLRIRTNGETFIDENKIVVADKMEAMERQRNDAMQLARELRDILEAVLPFIGATEAPEWACGDSYVIIRKADKLLCN